ncbi:hypothetical protein BCCR75502_03470 [Burkholderia sola]|nr:hypothetical protein BCCR75389_03455 [Burkholderia cenocepacia]CAG2308348.1 hypothetical protein BCCR75384_03470 [Burkholderia cenocepacia]CAG2308388.1 hypothetical protein BCCR75386_03471 [Burkholderia cenocepacia]CAG2308410.1 hypothetical protein BCCR75387_03470 [Burkholderia cenocepacia]CAG2308413.1 hypothetical protein BCCR12632_03473 [Burkholderia cenocepacia]
MLDLESLKSLAACKGRLWDAATQGCPRDASSENLFMAELISSSFYTYSTEVLAHLPHLPNQLISSIVKGYHSRAFPQGISQ